MMLHRHFESEKKPNLTKSADVLPDERPKGMDPEDPLYVPLKDPNDPSESDSGHQEDPEALSEEESPAPRRSRVKRV